MTQDIIPSQGKFPTSAPLFHWQRKRRGFCATPNTTRSTWSNYSLDAGTTSSHAKAAVSFQPIRHHLPHRVVVVPPPRCCGYCTPLQQLPSLLPSPTVPIGSPRFPLLFPNVYNFAFLEQLLLYLSSRRCGCCTPLRRFLPSLLPNPTILIDSPRFPPRLGAPPVSPRSPSRCILHWEALS